jgi:hypothetical protein
LETQLRAWRPRRPSAKLKARIFSAAHPPIASEQASVTDDDSHGATRHPWAWLAPVTAALLFVAVLFNQRNGPGFSVTATSSPMVAMALSNQSVAAWLPGSLARDVNGLPAETFEWTNGSGSTSSISSLPGWRGKN